MKRHTANCSRRGPSQRDYEWKISVLSKWVAPGLLVLFGITHGLHAQEGRRTDADPSRITMLVPPTERPVKMVLDTDTFNEIDDQCALRYALISAELEVAAELIPRRSAICFLVHLL